MKESHKELKELNEKIVKFNELLSSKELTSEQEILVMEDIVTHIEDFNEKVRMHLLESKNKIRTNLINKILENERNNG
jgi:hypothetical protein